MTIQIPSCWPVTQHTARISKGSTFVVIKGNKNNGIDFIKDALEKGASTIVVDQELPAPIHDIIKQYDARLMHVDNARATLADLCSAAYNRPQDKLKIIGITGTKGKTTTTFLTHHILQQAGFNTAMITGVKNYIAGQELPAELTTPHADYFYAFLNECVQAGVEYLVMEVSAQGLSLHRVDNVLFDGIIFTNLSQEHAEFYATMHDYFNAKVQLFERVKPATVQLINNNDTWTQQLHTQYPQATTISFTTQADYLLTNIQSSFGGLRFDIIDHNQAYTITSPTLFGHFNAQNCANAFLMAFKLGIDAATITQAIKTFMGVPGRMEGYPMPNGALGIVDYAHTPSSYKEVLSAVRALTQDLIVVFGAGGERDATKRPVMGSIAAEFADKIIITSDNPRSEQADSIAQQIKAGIFDDKKAAVYIELDREIAIKKAYALSNNGSIIMVLGKGPDEYQIIGNNKFFFSDKQVILSC